MKVLILSASTDSHAKAVHQHLDDLGATTEFLRYDDFSPQANTKLSYSLPANKARLEQPERTIDLSDYFSVWSRRPGQYRTLEYFEPWVSTMVQSETRATIDGILQSSECLWMNYPHNDLACRLKLWQLHIAAQTGLTIPKTLVTNDPNKARQFYDECNGEVIYKLIGETTNVAIPPSERPSGISTLPLRVTDLPFLDQVIHAPHLFQNNIKKSYDIRVTVIGTKIFAIRIDSQSGHGKVDWRHDYTVEMQAFELPNDIQVKCLQLMCRLGLNYGAIDFVQTDRDEYVFIEINCAGQYRWIEQRTELQISKTIALFLTGRSEPLIKAGHEREYALPQDLDSMVGS